MASTIPKPQKGGRKRNYMKQDVQLDLSIINDKQVHQNVEDCTDKAYDRQLQNWDDFVAKFGPKSVDSLSDLKEFVFRIGVDMKSRKRPNEPLSYHGIKNYWKKFTAGYRKHRGPINPEYGRSVTHFLHPKGELGRHLGVVADCGPRKHATASVLIWVGEFLWTLDWKVLVRPRLRVDLWAMLCLAAYTGARVSDYIESSARNNTNIGLRYKDATLIVFRNGQGEAEFAFEVTKFLKGNNPTSSKLPKLDIHEGGTQSPKPLYMNPILFHLAIFCARGALRDYRGKEGLLELLNVKPIPGQKPVRIRWDNSVLDQPVFIGAGGRMMTAGAFGNELRSLQFRAGFPDPPSLHCFRSETLTNIDMISAYSDTQRQKAAGHVNNQIHTQYYASRNPCIDSQSAYLGAQARLDSVGKHFREMEVKWEPALWQSLPAKEQERLGESDAYRATRARLTTALNGRALKVGGSPSAAGTTRADSVSEDVSGEESADGLTHPHLRHRRTLRRLKFERLKEYWKDQSSEAVAGSLAYVCKGVDAPFPRLRPVLPTRRRLADLLLLPARLRSQEGRDALLALVDLYESQTEVHRPGLDAATCLANPYCRAADGNRSQAHVYECKKRQSPFADFCFFCNEWFFDREGWEQHCRFHLEHDSIPKELAWHKVESSFLPGYCPFCLWDTSLAASERLCQFSSTPAWKSHIILHDVSWRSRCPDARCAEILGEDSFGYHMQDVHRVPKDLFRKSLKRKASTELASCLATTEKTDKHPRAYSFVFEYNSIGGT